MKEAGDLGAQLMHKLCNTIWRTMKWPEQWTQAILVLLPKTSDLKECTNYRTISLLSHASKVLLIIILNRLKNKSEMELPNEQAGFRPGRGTRDLLVNIQILIKKVNATQNSVLFLMFVDYTKAFDMVSHPKLFKVLLEIGAPRMSWIHNVLKWSGKTYGELKALAQDQKKWRRLSWEFSSAAELL